MFVCCDEKPWHTESNLCQICAKYEREIAGAKKC